MQLWDVIIIGGGAAGLMAAASAAEAGRSALLLEKNRKLGVKILMSGGTRCNITHQCDVRGIVAAFGKNGKFLHSALAALPPHEVIKKIEAQGVPTKAESTGKIFPVSDKAIDVRDALVRMAQQAGATIVSAAPVDRIEAINLGQDDVEAACESSDVSNGKSRFMVAALDQLHAACSIIITTGGKSFPGCGTTGDGYAWAEQFGHTIVPVAPALTPILSSCEWARELKGITLEDVHVRVLELPATGRSVDPATGQAVASPPKGQSKSKVLSERRASFLLTHWGFSGPAILDVSREVARHPDRKSLELVCDFWPSQSTEDLVAEMLNRKAADPRQQSLNLLPAVLPRRFHETLFDLAGVSRTIRNADLSKSQIHRLVQQLKDSRIPVQGTLGFEKAEVTSGGVSLSEVDSKTMESKRVKGLYFAGEVLDLDGRIGGYNFQSAFSTGWLAGKSV